MIKSASKSNLKYIKIKLKNKICYSELYFCIKIEENVKIAQPY